MNDDQNTPKTLPILLATNPFLRKKTRTVEKQDLEEIKRVLPIMFNTMYEAGGIGLAAPQVGIDLRFFIMDLMKNDQSEKIIIINPDIIELSEAMEEYKEGCLSFPDQFSEVVRPEKIRVRYLDMEGQQQEMEANGLLARCILHETDHLDGILFVDHISSLKRNIIIRKVKKEQKKHH